ncbi:MAG: VCBS repeat-containing protein [Deltaproteobacteria bacterium]|nr:VCBS repeat-containing protein [Deltaproteobacteria bacterium]
MPVVSLLLTLVGCDGITPIDMAPLDRDGDGVVDAEDACPADPAQATDADGDGVCDELDDACPGDPLQYTDIDGDGVCDEVDDACPDDIDQAIDVDGDGVCDEVDDDCPLDALGWTDGDQDGYCDESEDACPGDPDQWTDADQDGYCDEIDDDCPTDPMGFADTNGDGFCDDDDDPDLDGISTGEELSYGDDCAQSNPLRADTDFDGVDDNDDPYPRDPWPEYILFRNDAGTIDLMLSNRDGTFQTVVEIGDVHGGTVNTSYRYTGFVISDFDNDGTTDFLAYGDADPASAGDLDLWWFHRHADAVTFEQTLVGTVEHGITDGVADLDNDDAIDLLSMEIVKPSMISTAKVYTYLNTGLIGSAPCVFTEDPANPDGCAFIRKLAVDVTSFASGKWIVKHSRDAVDVDGDGNRDLVLINHPNGGNAAIPVVVLYGSGDGTFQAPGTPLFTHNAAGTMSPVHSMLFDDFDLDGLGDLIIGLDDDGDAGSAWFYKGEVSGSFGFDTSGAFESFDLNTVDESGGDNPGATSSARSFDFDFDGAPDVMVGWNTESMGLPPSKTVLLFGMGDGTFDTPIDIREYPSSSYGQSFAIPQRLCVRFSIQ